MSFEQFIPTIWNEMINRELERKCVFIENCNRQYEGSVKQKGDSVRILGVGKPTITSTTDKNIVLPDPETVEDTSITMPIQQIAYFNYKVDDIDKRQAVNGVMEALQKETTEGLANTMDKFVAKMALSKDALLDATAAYKVEEANILQKVDQAIQKLYESDVQPSAKITLTCSPRFYFVLKRAYVNLDTDNSKMIENGKVGRYGNVIVKMSNNVATSANEAEDRIMIRTDRAIAFVNPMTHTEPYRVEKGFSDAVKGFVLYDGKVVRPKEMIVMNVKYA